MPQQNFQSCQLHLSSYRVLKFFISSAPSRAHHTMKPLSVACIFLQNDHSSRSPVSWSKLVPSALPISSIFLYFSVGITTEITGIFLFSSVSSDYSSRQPNSLSFFVFHSHASHELARGCPLALWARGARSLVGETLPIGGSSRTFLSYSSPGEKQIRTSSDELCPKSYEASIGSLMGLKWVQSTRNIQYSLFHDPDLGPMSPGLQ